MNMGESKIYDNNVNQIYFDESKNHYHINLNNISNDDNYNDIVNCLYDNYKKKTILFSACRNKAFRKKKNQNDLFVQIGVIFEKIKKRTATIFKKNNYSYL